MKDSRFDHLEDLFKKYPDVPHEVVVKEDLLREGLMFQPQAVQFCKGVRRKTYQLFSWDFSEVEQTEDLSVLLPDILQIEGGLYRLRKMNIRPRLNVKSPYSIDLVDGELVVCDRMSGRSIAPVLPFAPLPDWCQKSFEDGTLYREVCPPDGDIIVFRQCTYWGPKEECKFCDINRNAVTKMKLSQTRTIAPKKVEQVAAVVEEMVLHSSVNPEHRPFHIHINGGSIINKIKGMTEFEFYIGYVDAIRERIGRRLPIMLQTTPWPVDLEKQAASRGNICRMSNFEVWDPELFAVICPGKNRVYGREVWIKGILDQVDIYGEGNVCPGFVAGVEMAKPWGFKTVEEAVQSTSQGMEFLMSHGVVPRPISWCVEALSDLAGQEPPPVDYFIQLDRNWFEIWSKYRLPPVNGLNQVGPGLNWYPNSASFDMGNV